MYHPIIQQSLADAHRRDLLTVANQERLARQSRSHRTGSGSASLEDRLSRISRLRHRPAFVSVAAATAAVVILIAGEV